MTTTNKTYITNWLKILGKNNNKTYKLVKETSYSTKGTSYSIVEEIKFGGQRPIVYGTLKELAKCIDLWIDLDYRYDMMPKE